MEKILLASLLAITPCVVKAQVKLGTAPSSINTNSALEIESTTKGVLIPRVLLTGSAAVAPLTATIPDGMLVFNVGTAIRRGFYYWDSSRWNRLSDSAYTSRIIGGGATVTGGSNPFSNYGSGTGVVMNNQSNNNTATTYGFASGINNSAGNYSNALGQSNNASGTNSFAVGLSNTSGGSYSAAIGNTNSSSGNTSFAVGNANSASAPYAVAMGNTNYASGNTSFAAGNGNVASESYSVAMGNHDTASGNSSFAVGNNNGATNTYSIAMGNSNRATGNAAIAMGTSNLAYGVNSVAMGNANTSSGNASFAFGAGTSASGDGAMSIGNATKAYGQNSFAAGGGSTAYGIDGIAMGKSATIANGANYATAIGDGANIGSNGSSSIALGFQAQANANYAAALGNTATATGTSSLALGASTTASGQTSVAIGRNANTNSKDYAMVLTDGNSNTSAQNAGQLYGSFQNGYLLNGYNSNTVYINADNNFPGIRPGQDNQQDLGGSSYRWRNIYCTNVSQTSDRRYKKDITNLGYGLSTVMSLRPVSYNWINGSPERKIGFIAQEVKEVVPEVVHTGDDAIQSLSINYSELTSVLVKAVQEQQAEIENLKKENAEIKALLKNR